MATARPEDFIRVGYENGRIPDCALKSVPGQFNVKLHPQAAEQLEKLLAEAKRQGFPFTVSSSYRTFNQQLSIVTHRNRGAASPGRSNHGWGTAIDILELYRAANTIKDELNRTRAADNRVDNVDPAVHARIFQTNPLYRWLRENAPKYGFVNPPLLQDGVGIDEAWHWEYQSWPLPSTVQFPPREPEVTKACVENLSATQQRSRRSSEELDEPPGTWSPFIASLESFHPGIQYELTKRRIASETANTYMPFVRLTSLTRVLSKNLQNGGIAYFPSLGPHGMSSIEFDDIYSPQSNRSIVGYAIGNINTESEEIIAGRVALVVEESATRTDPPNIPMPGITEISSERGTAGPIGIRGGLVKTNIKIVAYSVGQVDTLLRYFLRPATRVVIEWGRMSSNPTDTINPFPWIPQDPKAFDPDAVARTFTDLINSGSNLIIPNLAQPTDTLNTENPKTEVNFVNEYIYNNNGNYELFIGYVVQFNLKANKDNTYEISLVVHSIQQLEIPTRHTGVKSLCADASDKCVAMDIHEYFNDQYSYKSRTFKKLMELVENAEDYKYWKDNHVIPLKASNTQGTVPASSNGSSIENEYLVSWRFFVNYILNNEENGILSIIQDEGARAIIKNGLLKPVRETASDEDVAAETKLVANQVGFHQDLRSTNLNVMVIWNPAAQDRRSQNEKQLFESLIRTTLPEGKTIQDWQSTTEFEEKITNSDIGSFINLKKGSADDAPGWGSLRNGVWLNTQAIKQAFTSNDTVSAAINSLLTMMNTATEGYWNLQLYSAERPNPGMFVIDWGLSKKQPAMNVAREDQNSFPWIDNEENELTNILSGIDGVNISRFQKSNDEAGKNEPKYIYMFNRKTKRLRGGELGSDILDLNVEFSLPQVIAVQAIAGVGGPAQKSLLQSIDIDELNSISMIPRTFATCTTSSVCLDVQCDDEELQKLIQQRDEAERAAQVASSTAQQRITPALLGNEGTALLGALEGIEATKAQQKVEAIQLQVDSVTVARKFGNPTVVDSARELSSLGTLLDFIEFNPSTMVKKLNIDSLDDVDSGRVSPAAHAFNSSNLTKTIASVTLPGIGGIELFQSFLIDRVPSILERGFYVVTKIVHKFAPSSGWITTIEGRFRFRPDNENKGTGHSDCAAGLIPPNPSAGYARGLYGPGVTTDEVPTANPIQSNTGDPALDQGRFIAPGVLGTDR